MFKIYLGRTISPGVGISLPVTIEEMREAYSLLDGTGIVPLETTTAYVGSSIPNPRQYLYEVPVLEERLEELNYLAYRVKWMDSRDEVVLGIVIEMMKPETLQNIINLSCSMDKFKYLPDTATETKLGEYLLRGYLGITTEEQAVRSNYEWIGKDYIKKHDGMFHAFSYTNGIQEELEPIYRGSKLLDPDFEQTCSLRVWVYRGNSHDNYTLTLLAAESKMGALKGAMGVLNQSECKQLGIQCRVPTLWDQLPECGSIEELNDLVTEHRQSMENQQAPVLEMQMKGPSDKKSRSIRLEDDQPF